MIRDFTRHRESFGQWALGGLVLNQFASTLATIQTMSGITPPRLTGGSAVTFVPVALPPAVTLSKTVRKVRVRQLEGQILDVTDVCGSGTFASIQSVAESLVAMNLASPGGDIGIYAYNPSAHHGFAFDSTVSQGACPCGAGFAILAITIYVMDFSVKTGLWQVRFPFNDADGGKDYEFLIADAYHLPLTGFAVPYSGRSWRLSLPREIILGAGQALAVTVSLHPASTFPVGGGGVDVAPFFRTLIQELQ